MRKHYRFVAQGSQTSIKQGDKGVIDMSVGMVERNDGFVPYAVDGQPGIAAGGLEVGGCQIDADGDGPMAYVITDRQGVQHRLSRLPFVTMDFGLREVGHLSQSIVVDLPASMRPGANGEGQVGVHGDDQWHDAARISTTVTAAVDQAIARECHALGRVCQPVFVRYALRMFDGKSAWVSSPVLLMTSPYQPPVTVSAVTDVDDDTCRAEMHLSQVRTFAIDYRIVDGLPSWLMALVAGIDVYMSAPIATYGTSDNGCIMRYGTVIGDAPLGTSSRFAGHYAAIGQPGLYIDHYLDDADLQRQSWYLAPNVAFESQLTGCVDYYRVVSLPFLDIEAMDGFRQLPIRGFDIATLKKLPRLDDDGAMPMYGRCAAVTADGRLFVAPRCKYPAPLPTVRSAMAMAGDANGVRPVATAQVWLYDEAQACCTQSVGDVAMTADLSAAFPRYIYVPHPDAYRMSIRQGAHCYVLPLRRHADGRGAYWFGGFGDGYAPTPGAEPPSLNGEDRGYVDVCGMVAASAPGNPWVFPCDTVSIVTSGEISALARVRQNLSQGQMGQFLLYAFASDGVLALAIGRDGRCTAVQTVSTAVNSALLCETASGAAMATGGALMLLEGTRSLRVELPDYAPLVGRLPRLGEMATAMGTQLPVSQGLAIEEIYYNVAANAVCVRIGGVLWCYDLQSGGWVADGGTGVLVTAPLVPGGDGALTTLRQAAVRGRFANGAVSVALYGSNDLAHWHLLATRRYPAVRGIGGGPYRAYRAVVFARKDAALRIDGISLDVTDRFASRL